MPSTENAVDASPMEGRTLAEYLMHSRVKRVRSKREVVREVVSVAQMWK